MNRIVPSMLTLGLLFASSAHGWAKTPIRPPPSNTQDPKESKPDAGDLWRLVAQSDVIVKGTLKVPVETIKASRSSEKHRYVKFRVIDCEPALKGAARRALYVKWHTDDRWPNADRMLAMDGKKAVLFLTSVTAVGGDGDSPMETFRGLVERPGTKSPPVSNMELYFAGHTAQSLSDPGTKVVEQVRAEVKAQRELLRDFAKNHPPEKVPLYAKVKDLIDATTRDKDSQMAAFRDLEALGHQAVPAMIVLMDDRRKLAIDQISLRNHNPNAFEGIRHYGPKTVVDAMDALLNQITGEIFGNVQNGGSESERRAAVNGWRIYLVRGHEGPEKKKDSSPGPSKRLPGKGLAEEQ